LVLPETERLAKRVFSLPTGAAVDRDAIKKICQIIKVAVANSYTAKEKLSGHVAV
jgi:dTDP-4-amino-4,6-dideoxygalactose transaminase